MEIRHLDYFLAVARYKSFSMAAESIHVSQPTLSRTIRELEDELGVQLFRRTNKAVQLTHEGEHLSAKASDIVGMFYGLKSQTHENSHTDTGRIYIGLPPITSAVVFADILGGFKNLYPNITVSLTEQGPRRIEKLLLDGLLDFGVFLPENKKAYEWEWFDQDLHAVVMPPNHPLSGKAQIDYTDLKDELLIIYNSDYIVHDQILEGFDECDIQPKIGLETIQRDLMVMLVEAGFGLAIMPKKLAARLEIERRSCVARPMNDPRLKMNLALVRKKTNYYSREAKLFKQYFHEKIEQSNFSFIENGLPI